VYVKITLTLRIAFYWHRRKRAWSHYRSYDTMKPTHRCVSLSITFTLQLACYAW